MLSMMKKRLLSIVTTAALLTTMIPFSSIGSSDTQVVAAAETSAPASEHKLTGQGTEESPYQIASKSDLESMRDAIEKKIEMGEGNQPAVSAHYKLTQDIDLKEEENWTPIGRSNPFKGVFDGNGHNITGMKIKKIQGDGKRTDSWYYGLFGQIGAGGTVKNLTVEGSVNISFGWYLGLIVGLNEGSVENCSAKGNVIASFYFGGIAGCTSKKSAIKNCYADVDSNGKGSSKFGSVTGYADGECDLSGTCFLNHGYTAVGMNPSTDSKTTSLTTDEVAKGKAAWLLRNAQGEDTKDVYWGQKLPSETTPKLSNSDDDRVYKATFMYSGQEVAEQYANKNGKFTAPEIDYDNDGYTAGEDWYENKELSGEKYSFDTIVTKDIILYGGKALVDYTITLDLDGGTLDDEQADGWNKGEDDTYIKKYNINSDEFTLPTPTKKDHDFVGWTLSENAETKVKSNEEKPTVTIPKGSTGNKTYTAVYRDNVGPEITITLGDRTWTGLHEASVPFDVYLKEPQEIKITAVDNIHDKDNVTIYYMLSSTARTEEELKSKSYDQIWQKYSDGCIKMDKQGSYIIYVKSTDEHGNASYASTTGIVFDITKPVISGIANGSTYCESIEFTINDTNLAKVTVDNDVIYNYEGVVPSADSGIVAVALGDKKFSVTFNHEGTADVAIKATDKAGNETEYTVKINGQHVEGFKVTEMRRAASCINIGEGIRLTYCKNCGLIMKREDDYTEPMTKHSWSAWTEVSSVLCGDTTRERKCSTCGLVETETENGSHKWADEYTIDKEPTCINPGQKSKHCTVCGISNPKDTVPVGTLEHQPGNVKTVVVKEATCTTDGGTETVILCKDCLSEIGRTYEVIPAKGHTFTEWEKIQTPSNPESGTMKRECTVCGYSETASYHTDHEWGATKEIDKEPTCTANGSKSFHCKNCSSTKESETIPALGHKELEPVKKTVIAATCTEAGRYNEVVYCETCKEAVRSKPVTDPAKGHTFGEWEEVVSAVTGEANEQRSCKDCGFTETRGVDLENHKWSEEKIIDEEPTCTEEGSKSYHCTVCGLKKDSEVISELGHTWGEWEEVVSTVTGEANEQRSCKVCYYTETRGVDPKNHKLSKEKIIDKAPTCTEEGSKSYHCEVCGLKIDSEVIPKLDHTWGEWKEVYSPTNDTSNYERSCTVCGYTETKGMDLENHKLSKEKIIDKAPTCTEEGSKSYHCEVCGLKIDSEVIPKLDHTWGEWKVTVKPTYENAGEQERECSVCKAKDKQIIPKYVKATEDRLEGANRYGTASDISQELEKYNSGEKIDTIILAYGLNYADALAGVPLAKALNAPILLTTTNMIPEDTVNEIKRLKEHGAKNVIILGGTGVISDTVKKQIEGYGLKTDRIDGKNRYETAVQIAEKLNPNPTEIFFVYGLNFADALSVSTVAAIKDAPILYLTTDGKIPEATEKYLATVKGKVKKAYVIGGDGVISKDMMGKAANALGLKVDVDVTRVWGANRYETCVAINTTFASVLTGNSICVATGLDFPDALTGGVLAAVTRSPLMLVDIKLRTEQVEYLKSKNAEKVYVFGGEKGAVPADIVESVLTPFA